MSIPVVAVDLGRSSARVAVVTGHGVRRRPAAVGAGLDGPDGAVAVAVALRSAIGDDVPPGRWTLAVAVPGALTHPEAAGALADALAADRSLGTPPSVVVTSDVVAWHAGAFGADVGTDRVLLAVGTGAVALGVAADGTVRRIDGHGLLLGDAGGGARLGQEGLRAALRAAEGTGPATALDAPARALLARGRPADAAGLATFAPAVLEAAAAGDAVARAIVDDAVAALAATVAAAPGPADPRRGPAALAVVGGLADALGDRVAAACPGMRRRAPDGDATAGLARLASDASTPHEPAVVRRERRETGPATLGDLPTEGVRPGSEALDARPVDELVAVLLDGQASAPAAVAAAAGPLARAAEALGAALRGGGRLVYAGAGTSGRLATQDAAELPPTFGLDPVRARALLAGGAGAAGTALENAEDDEEAGRRDLAGEGVGPGDVVVGVAASGRTPYVLGVLAAARERGTATVAVVNVAGSPAAVLAGTAIELLTGPEVLAGSTRLAAGTAQKIALNTLTTAAMVRAGATYGPWMVRMRATNAKLRGRAERIVRDAAGVDADVARAALADAGGEVATALVALLGGVDATTARARLSTAGSVRAAAATTREGHP